MEFSSKIRIYTLEKQVNNPEALEAGEVESAPLLNASPDTDAIFRQTLDNELEKVCSFYDGKEKELYKEMDDFVHDAETYLEDTAGIDMDTVAHSIVKPRSLSFGDRARQSSIAQGLGMGIERRTSVGSDSLNGNGDNVSDDDLDISETPSGDVRRPSSRGFQSKHGREPPHEHDGGESADARLPEHERDPHVSALYGVGVTLKKRAISVYVSLCELKSFIQLNRTGFTKALKKYDKTLDRSMRRGYMNSTVSLAYPFTNYTVRHLDDRIEKIEKLYAGLVTNGDIGLSKRELRLHLREHVVWERNTVWREMIGIERKAQAANVGIRRTLLGGEEDPESAQRQGDEQQAATKELVTPVGRFPVPRWMLSSTFATLIGIVAVFGVLLAVPIMDEPEQQNCLAILVFVSLLWATEVRMPSSRCRLFA